MHTSTCSNLANGCCRSPGQTRMTTPVKVIFSRGTVCLMQSFSLTITYMCWTGNLRCGWRRPRSTGVYPARLKVLKSLTAPGELHMAVLLMRKIVPSKRIPFQLYRLSFFSTRLATHPSKQHMTSSTVCELSNFSNGYRGPR